MKKIEININDDTYAKLSEIVNWLNLDNKIQNIDDRYTIEDFVLGAAHNQSKMVEEYLIKPYDIEKKPVFKNRFKEIAKERGVRQVDICNKLGVQKSNLSHIFSNAIQPRSELFFKIWVLLGCPPIHECIYFEAE